MKGSYLGPKYNEKEIEKELTMSKAKYVRLDEKNLLIEVCKQLSNNKAMVGSKVEWSMDLEL